MNIHIGSRFNLSNDWTLEVTDISLAYNNQSKEWETALTYKPTRGSETAPENDVSLSKFLEILNA